MYKLSTTWVKGIIQLQTPSGATHPAKSDLLGVWGVHKSLGRSDWSVTHILSGRRLTTTPLKRDAKALVSALLDIDPKFRTADVSYLESKQRDILSLIRDPSRWSVSSKSNKPRKQKVSVRRAELAAMITSGGLRNLGARYGKAGDFYGVKGSSRAIALGKREVLKNVFNVQIYRDGHLRKPQTSWGMLESKLISQISDAEVTQWVAWASEGLTMVEIRAIAKKEYINSGAASTSGARAKVATGKTLVELYFEGSF